MRYPQWLRVEEVTLRSIWDGREESPRSLAVRLSATLDALDRALGDRAPWSETHSDVIIEPGQLERCQAVIEAGVDRDGDGVAWPTYGYSFHVMRRGRAGTLSLSVTAGASRRGRRLPSNTIGARIAGPVRDGQRKAMSAEFIEAVLHSVVAAWDPDSAAVCDRDGIERDRHPGHFAPIAGQHAWVSDRVGSIETSTSGVTVAAGDGGWNLTADDRLDSRSAVSEVRATLEANGLVEIPRTGTAPKQQPSSEG